VGGLFKLRQACKRIRARTFKVRTLQSGLMSLGRQAGARKGAARSQAYARRKLLHALPLRRHHYRLATRALELIAVRGKRSATGSGRAWLWRPLRKLSSLFNSRA